MGDKALRGRDSLAGQQPVGWESLSPLWGVRGGGEGGEGGLTARLKHCSLILCRL